MLRESGPRGKPAAPELEQLKQELDRLEARGRAFEAAEPARGAEAAHRPAGSDASPRAVARRGRSVQARGSTRARPRARKLLAQQSSSARRRSIALDQRLSRLLRRARLGRIETVLGKKRALELEIEALSEGFLPPGRRRFAGSGALPADDEEYWPFDGEDWDGRVRRRGGAAMRRHWRTLALRGWRSRLRARAAQRPLVETRGRRARPTQRGERAGPSDKVRAARSSASSAASRSPR